MEVPSSSSRAAAQAGTALGGPPSSGRRLHDIALISVLVALMLTLLLEALDQTVVGTALPKIIGDLNGFSLYTWVLSDLSKPAASASSGSMPNTSSKRK